MSCGGDEITLKLVISYGLVQVLNYDIRGFFSSVLCFACYGVGFIFRFYVVGLGSPRLPPLWSQDRLSFTRYPMNTGEVVL